MNLKTWQVHVVRGGDALFLGTVSEATESLARCAALSRYAACDDEVAEAEVRLRGAAIYPDDDFEVLQIA